MKKTIITMLVAIVAIASVEARPVKKATHKSAPATEQKEAASPKTDDGKTGNLNITDSAIHVKNGDKNVVIKFGDLEKLVRDHLDDTVLSSAGITISSAQEVEEDQVDKVTDEEVKTRKDDALAVDFAYHGMDLARDITQYFAIAIVWIVALSLLFYYLHRRRKYKTIDRAIMNKYPLPDEFYGKRSYRTPQQPTTVYINQMTPPSLPNDSNAPGASQGSQQAPPAIPYVHSNNPLNNITDWAPFKSGLITTAVGLGLMFFFWIVGASPIAALMVIVVFIGLGKLFFTYQEQQSIKNYWQNQQWSQQAQQPQQTPQWQGWQQPVNNQPTANEVPPMPETPPEFTGEEE